MEFSIDKHQLMVCLDYVKQAIPTKTTNLILKNIHMEATKEGELILRSFNNILEITTTTTCNVSEEGVICVDSLILNLIPNLSDGDINFKFNNGKFLIKQGRRKHSPIYVDAKEFPEKLHVDDYQVVNKNLFHKALTRTSIALSNLADRPILQGYFINPHDQIVLTGDGNRVALWEDIESPGNITTPHGKLISPVLSFIKALQDEDSFELSLGVWSGARGVIYGADNSVDFMWEVIFNSLSGDFPEVAKKVIIDTRNSDPVATLVIPKSTFTNHLEICALYSERAYNEGKSNNAILTKNGIGVMLTMKIPGLVEMEEHLECEATGGDIELWFHPPMLHSAVSAFESNEIEMRIYGSKKPFILLDKENPQFTYLQVPMAMPKEIRELRDE